MLRARISFGDIILPATLGEQVNKNKIAMYCGECCKRNREGGTRKDRSRAPPFDGLVRRGMPEKVVLKMSTKD